MSLQELKKSEMSEVDEINGKSVTVFLQSFFYKLVGNWCWEMEAEVVFCSDVMLSPPNDFIGIRGLLHPDDVVAVKEKLPAGQTQVGDMKFRIITSYGEVKTLVGRSLVCKEAGDALSAWQDDMIEEIARQREAGAALRHLQLQQQVYEQNERFSNTGNWYYNSSRSETWYSDNIFRLHGVLPQSLNAHLHTFHSFIHPEDESVVKEFMEKAYEQKASLQMEYRIVTASGEKHIAYRSQWIYSEAGECVLCGTMEDITGQKALEQQAEGHKELVHFHKQQLAFDEQQAGIGHWQLDLLTRKASFSDNYYRILGLKPGAYPETGNFFTNFIHPDDQEGVVTAYRKMLYEHVLHDLEYRIIRPDGKTRFISQRAKMMKYKNEMVVSGIIRDITVQRQLERKQDDLQDLLAQRGLQQLQVDEMASMGSWVMDLQTESITWSENMQKLLGYKTGGAPLFSERLLFSCIHPNDVKKFKDYWRIVLDRAGEPSFDFRINLRGTVRHMKALFRIRRLREKDYFIGTVQDVTAENVLEHKLAQRVQLAESLSENITDRVMITDVNNTVVLWNRAAEETYGIKKGDALGQNFFDLFPQLKTEEQMQLFHRVFRGERVVQQGSTSVTAKGYFDLSLMPLWSKGEVSGILHIIHDVTRETELRNSLKERLVFIERLLESSVDRIIALDHNLDYQYWNSRAEAYYGVPKKKVIGRNVLEVFPQIRHDPSFGEFRRALRGETVHIPASIHEQKNFETYLIPVKGEGGEVVSILWIAHDLSRELHLQQQQKEAQEQLKKDHALLVTAEKQIREQSHFIRRVTETVPDMISVMELETKKVEYLNREVFLAHGFDPEMMNKKSREELVNLIHVDDRLVLADYYRQFGQASEKETITAEYRALTSAGQWKWFRVRGKSFQRDEQGKVTHILNVIQDITAHKQAEETLRTMNDALVRTNRELETKNEEITSFAFVASHDLREPIRKLHTFSDWLLTREKAISEAGRASLKKMTISIKRLDTLIDDIMALSQAHLANEKPKRVDLNTLLQAVKDDMNESIECAGAQVEAGPLPCITGAETLLFSLFKNLLANSIRFRQKGSSPHIRIQAVPERVGDKEGVSLSFTDNGIGFLPAYNKKIFRIFQRLNSREEFEGTGMGLAICKKIMEKHHGTISAEGEPGKGATFTCWFPSDT